MSLGEIIIAEFGQEDRTYRVEGAWPYVATQTSGPTLDIKVRISHYASLQQGRWLPQPSLHIDDETDSMLRCGSRDDFVARKKRLNTAGERIYWSEIDIEQYKQRYPRFN